jgi:hypothetical protein
MLNPTKRGGQTPTCEDFYHLMLRRYIYSSAANILRGEEPIESA